MEVGAVDIFNIAVAGSELKASAADRDVAVEVVEAARNRHVAVLAGGENEVAFADHGRRPVEVAFRLREAARRTVAEDKVARSDAVGGRFALAHRSFERPVAFDAHVAREPGVFAAEFNRARRVVATDHHRTGARDVVADAVSVGLVFVGDNKRVVFADRNVARTETADIADSARAGELEPHLRVEVVVLAGDDHVVGNRDDGVGRTGERIVPAGFKDAEGLIEFAEVNLGAGFDIETIRIAERVVLGRLHGDGARDRGASRVVVLRSG